MPEATREEKMREVSAIADAICDLVATREHGLTLDALLCVYKALAKKFPCCTQHAANACMASAVELAQVAALRREASAAPTEGARLH